MGEVAPDDAEKGFVEAKGKDVLAWCRRSTEERTLADLQAGVKDLSRWEQFRSVPDKILLSLAASVKVRHFKENEVLFRQSHHTDRNCYFVWAGSVSLFVKKKTRPNPEERSVNESVDATISGTEENSLPSLHESSSPSLQEDSFPNLQENSFPSLASEDSSLFRTKLLLSHERNSVFIGLFEEEVLPEIRKVENHGHLVAVKPPGKMVGKLPALNGDKHYATAVAANNTYVLEIPPWTFHDLLALEEEKEFANDTIFLRNTPCFKWLDDDTLVAAAACFSRQQFVAKAEVCQQGSFPGRFFLVREGECEVLRHVRHERVRASGANETIVETIHVADLGEHDLYGHWELLEEQPSLFSVKAKTALEVWTLTVEDLATVGKAGDPDMIVRELHADGEMSTRFHRHRTRVVGSVRFGEQRQLFNKRRAAVEHAAARQRKAQSPSPEGDSPSRAGETSPSHVVLPDPESAIRRGSEMANKGLHRRVYSRTINPAAYGVRGPREMKAKGLLIEMEPDAEETAERSRGEEWLDAVAYAPKDVLVRGSHMPGREAKVQQRLEHVTQLLYHAAAVAHGDDVPEPTLDDAGALALKRTPSYSKEWINLTTFLSVLNKSGLTVKAGGELGVSVGEQLPENKASVVFLAAARALRNRLHPPGCIPFWACLQCLRKLCSRLYCPIPPCLLTQEETHAQQRTKRKSAKPKADSPHPQWESPFLKRSELPGGASTSGWREPPSEPELPPVFRTSVGWQQTSPPRPPRAKALRNTQFGSEHVTKGISGISLARTDLSAAATLPSTPSQASPLLAAKRRLSRSSRGGTESPNPLRGADGR